MKTQRYLQLALVVVAALVVLRVVGVNSGGLGLLLIIVACPLMMFFMMRNMGGMNHKDDADHDPQHRV